MKVSRNLLKINKINHKLNILGLMFLQLENKLQNQNERNK